MKRLYYWLRYKLTGKIYIDTRKFDVMLLDIVMQAGLEEMLKEKDDELHRPHNG